MGGIGFEWGFPHLIIGGDGLVWVLNIVCRSENLLRLLDGVFNLASDKEGGQGGVLVVVLGVAETEAKAVEVDTGRIEGADGELELLAHAIEKLNTL